MTEIMKSEKEILRYFIDSPFTGNEHLVKHLNNFISAGSAKLVKSSAASDELRNKAGKLLTKTKKHNEKFHRQIFVMLNGSVCKAPNGSKELALAYKARADFLFHLCKYEDCARDLDRLLESTNSTVCKTKLLCKKFECLSVIGSPESNDTFTQAKSCLDKIGKRDKNKAELGRLLKATESSVKCCQPLPDFCAKKISDEEETRQRKILADKHLTKAHESIRVERNRRYGRHLVANKDFDAGEIVFSEDLYAWTLDPDNVYVYCHNCSKVCWTGVPCGDCAQAIFCGERCLKEAKGRFHDLECLLLTHLSPGVQEILRNLHLALRILIIGLKEAGSDVSKLRAEIEAVERRPADDPYRGILRDGRFESSSIRGIYSMQQNEKIVMEFYCVVTVEMLKCLAEHTNLFGEKKKIKVIADLKSENTLFFGALFIRLCSIIDVNAINLDSNCWFCDILDNGHVPHGNNPCCRRGTCIALFHRLINHSCVPNCMSVYTDDLKVFYFASRPIKKNEQIFRSYGMTYDMFSKSERAEHLLPSFECKCIGCKEDWPKLKGFITESKDKFESQLIEYVMHLNYSFYDKCTTFGLEDVRKVSKAITKAVKHLKQPNEALLMFEKMLYIVYSCMYGIRTPEYGLCSKSSLTED